MRELNVNETQAVGGGWVAVGIRLYRVLSKVNWGTASYSDMMIAP